MPELDERDLSSAIGRRTPFEFLSQMAADLSSGIVALPSLSHTVAKLRTVLQDPASTPQQISRLISLEPIVAGRLLQMANSAAFNATGPHVTDLNAALTRLGSQRVYNVVLACALREIKDSPSLQPIARQLNELWVESIAVGHFCDSLARRSRLSPAHAFVTGLLHGMGRLYIMAQVLKQNAGAVQVQLDEDLVEKWHPAIAKAVLENWELDESVCDAVGAQNERDGPDRGVPTLADVLVASLALAQVLREGHQPLGLFQSSAFVRLHLTTEFCQSLVSEASGHIRALTALLNG